MAMAHLRCVGRAVVLATAFSGSALAVEFRCPETITSYQQLADPAPGWTGFSRDYGGTAGNPAVERLKNHSAFSHIEVYDGEPKELADLMPDNGVDTWSFEAPSPSDRPLYMACVYGDTFVRLVKRLPADVVKCRAAKDGVLRCDQAKARKDAGGK